MKQAISMGLLSIVSSLALAGAGVAQTPTTTTYTYDAHGRVVKVEHTGGTNDGVEIDYEYDDADNRTRKKTTGA